MIQIFPEAGTRGAPFTLKEIAAYLSEAYSPIPYSRVYRAWANLAENPHTMELVQPLPSPDRTLLFTAASARRVARRVVKGRLPTKYKQYLADNKKSRGPRPCR